MHQWDLKLFHAINGLSGHSAILDHIMEFFAQYALELYALLFVLAWFAYPRKNAKGRNALVVAVVAGVVALLVNVIIAHIWPRNRPFVTLAPGQDHVLISHSADASFPSDHTAGSFGFASASWGVASKWISHGFTTLAVIVMFARVYCGVHWPTDVIGGFIVGTVSGLVVKRFARFLQPLTNVGLRIFKYGQYKA